MRLRAPLLLSFVVLAFAPSAPAQVAPPSSPVSSSGAPIVAPPPAPSGTRIDPKIRALFGFRARTGLTAPTYLASERFEREGVLPVVVRFANAPSAAKLAAATIESMRLATGAYAAKITAPQLALLEADPNVLRVTVDLPRRAPRPLDQSASETGIAAARRSLRKKDGTLLDGAGVRIADIDSGTFVFHPSFYRADGGVHAWVDVDNDGQLTAGVDGVDLDGSGAIDPSEVLRAMTVDLDGRAAGFDAGLDYLYVDANNNGARDYGQGFGEETPAHGEPIFVVDDVNGDGKLASSEKLLRLGTSKVAAARSTRTYTRGHGTLGIHAYGSALMRSPEELEYASHGTGVAGILVGGVPDRSRLLGLAPGAELLAVGYGGRDPDGTTASVQWAINQKADVILTEYAPYTGYPLDGSTEEEQLLSKAVEMGIAVVNPAGNLARGFKHRTVKLVAGSNTVAMKTDGAFRGAPYIALTMLHRGGPRALTLKLSLPDGTIIDVPASSTGGPVELSGDRFLDVVRQTSPRGTHQIDVALYAWNGTTFGALPEGSYQLSIDSDDAVEAELYCSDSNNSWAYGLTFHENTPTRTLCHPATNDKGLAIAAYTLHADDPFGGGTPGMLASYSSIGPRIDGDVGMDLAAPDNPFSTTVPERPSSKAIGFAQFGGTSGAGPHVAAAIALLKQLDPKAGGEALQNKLLATARRDGVSNDETRWGKGKLDVAAALGIPRRTGVAPKVKIVAPDPAPIGRPVELRVEVEDDAGELRARWDLDYDGTADGAFEAIAPRTLQVDAPAVKDVKVEVLDADGYLAGATARIVFADVPLTPASAPSTEDGGCGCTTPGHGSTRSAVFAATFAAALLARRRSRMQRG